MEKTNTSILSSGVWRRASGFEHHVWAVVNSVKRIELVDEFDDKLISDEIIQMGDVDLGFMNYRVAFSDGGKPVNDDWDNPKFSDSATTVYYRPHMIKGVIDVGKYREGQIC